MFEIIHQVSVRHGKAVEVQKVIAIDAINKVRRLCFGGALLPALFSKVSFFLEMSRIGKNTSFL